MKIARVNNINETIKFLKQNDIWICGTDGQAKTYYYQQDFKMPVAIIIGSEGYGMSRLVKENCDFLVKIPMKGKITSLNASVSAGIVNNILETINLFPSHLNDLHVFHTKGKKGDL